MKRIGIPTVGGDAPGLNAVIRAAVKIAIYEYDCEVFGNATDTTASWKNMKSFH